MGAPEWYHFRHGKYTYEPTAYTNDGMHFHTILLSISSLILTPCLADYFADVSRVYREEIQDLYGRGCRKCL